MQFGRSTAKKSFDTASTEPAVDPNEVHDDQKHLAEDTGSGFRRFFASPVLRAALSGAMAGMGAYLAVYGWKEVKKAGQRVNS